MAFWTSSFNLFRKKWKDNTLYPSPILFASKQACAEKTFGLLPQREKPNKKYDLCDLQRSDRLEFI